MRTITTSTSNDQTGRRGERVRSVTKRALASLLLTLTVLTGLQANPAAADITELSAATDVETPDSVSVEMRSDTTERVVLSFNIPADSDAYATVTYTDIRTGSMIQQKRLDVQSQTWGWWNVSKTTVEPFTLLGPSPYFHRGVEVEVTVHGAHTGCAYNDHGVGVATVSAPSGNQSDAITCAGFLR